MNRISLLILSLSASLSLVADASPTSAALVQKEYQASMEKWSLEMRLATTPATRDAALAKRPDPNAFAKRMWTAIGPSLREEWTLEPAAWFLSLSAGLIVQKPDGTPVLTYATERESIRQAVEAYHLASPKLTPMCFALTAGSDPGTLALLEKISNTHPDKKVQGAASMAAALVLRASGDTPELLAKRITHIRKAIIESADVEIDGTSVSKLAADELYIIKNLTKGRVGPDLQGVDSAGRPMSLSQHKGKIIVLIFWNSNLPEATRVNEFAIDLGRKFAGQPVVILGINNDPLEKLRALNADRTVEWPNFSDPENKLATEYRIGTWPLAYVLDGERKINFAGVPGSFVEFAVSALLNPEPATPE